MKKLTLLLFAIFFLFASMTFAEPFLVCDPQPAYDVSHYIITGDINVTVEAIPVEGMAGFVMLKYDLEKLASGEYHIEVVAKKDAWPSDPAPFTFTKLAVGAPKNVRIE